MARHKKFPHTHTLTYIQYNYITLICRCKNHDSQAFCVTIGIIVAVKNVIEMKTIKTNKKKKTSNKNKTKQTIKCLIKKKKYMQIVYCFCFCCCCYLGLEECPSG